MHGSTFLLGPLSFDRRNAEKISFFFSLSPISLFLSLLCFPFVRFFHLLFFLGFPPFSLLFIFSFGLILSHRIVYFLFVCSFPLFFLIFSFSLIFSSLSFPSFYIFFFSFALHQLNGPKSGKLPPTSFFATCHSPSFLNFFSFSFIFLM